MEEYEVHHNNNVFRLKVSPNSPGWTVTCLYMEPGRMLKAPGQDGSHKMKNHHVNDTSKDEALTQMGKWLTDQFDVPAATYAEAISN